MIETSRRAFLTSTLAGVASFAWAETRNPDDLGQGPCTTATPRATLAPSGEPGLRMRVLGRLFAPDGTSPAAGAILYAYQTDATGVYNKDRGAPPRLRGFMKTDADGRFEYDTIRPGSYPGTRVPAHVHHHAWGGGWPAQWLTELNFTDDPFLSAADKARSEAAGTFAWIRTPRSEGGVLVVDLHVRLGSGGTSFESNILHGRAACGLS
jgi:protocatechuate 3,4-dioxygenase beta subunit